MDQFSHPVRERPAEEVKKDTTDTSLSGGEEETFLCISPGELRPLMR